LTAASPIGWIRQIAEPRLLGPAGLFLGLAGLALWTLRDVRAAFAGWPDLPGTAAVQSRQRLPLELLTLGYLVFLIAWIGDLQARYALPLLPGLLLFAAATLLPISQRVRAGRTMLAVALLALLLPIALASFRYEHYQMARAANPAVRDRVAAGRWLTQNVPATSRILHDAYTYVPPSFTITEQTFGLTHSEIALFRPRIIVTDIDIRERFRDPGGGSHYQGGPAEYAEIAMTYSELESGSLACFPRLVRFGPVEIYGRLGSGPAAGC
jgi:hypothetical protein